MDCVYSSWTTRDPDGFTDAHVAALQRLAPFLALAVKSVSLARMAGTLMQTYLGRDAGRRVLSGRIVRGVADRIDAVLWFSDLRGFTRITDTTPEQVIPLLNDYADVDRLGDPRPRRRRAQADRRRHARDLHRRRPGRAPASAALAAAVAARQGVAALNARRAADGLPVTDMYLGLHVGEVFYGNIGSTRPARLHRDRARGQRGQPHRRDVPLGRSADAGVRRVRQCRQHQGAAGLGRPLRAARRRQPQELFTLDPGLAD